MLINYNVFAKYWVICLLSCLYTARYFHRFRVNTPWNFTGSSRAYLHCMANGRLRISDLLCKCDDCGMSETSGEHISRLAWRSTFSFGGFLSSVQIRQRSAISKWGLNDSQRTRLSTPNPQGSFPPLLSPPFPQISFTPRFISLLLLPQFATRRFDNRSRLDALIIYQAARVTGDRPIKLKQEAGSRLSALQRPSLLLRFDDVIWLTRPANVALGVHSIRVH